MRAEPFRHPPARRGKSSVRRHRRTVHLQGKYGFIKNSGGKSAQNSCFGSPRVPSGIPIPSNWVFSGFSGAQEAPHFIRLLFNGLSNRKSQHQDQCEGDSGIHLLQSSNRMLLESKHIIDSAVHTFNRTAFVVEFLPLSLNFSP